MGITKCFSIRLCYILSKVGKYNNNGTAKKSQKRKYQHSMHLYFQPFFLTKSDYRGPICSLAQECTTGCLDGKLVSPAGCNGLSTSLGYSAFISLWGKPMTFPTV